jgi:AcrR family transcriptional regulator
MSMSISYEETGRAEQKARTKGALISAARDLLAQGPTPTVEEAAAAANISRATAYRYFPNQRALLTATFPDLGRDSLLGEAPPEDPQERLEFVVDAITRQVLDHEPALRSMLRLSLEPDPAARGELPFRKGRRIVWISEALAPLQGDLSGPKLERLVTAVAAAVGIDALVWLVDVAGLSRARAVELMRWSALALLRAALAEG